MGLATEKGHPPFDRRTEWVYVRDVSAEERFAAAREECSKTDDEGERMLLFGLALDPGELGAWVEP